MSTTLVPLTYYVVKPCGQAARHYLTIAQAASAIAQLARTPTTMSAITGRRTRSLTETELRELRQCVGAYRLHAGRARREDGREVEHGRVGRS